MRVWSCSTVGQGLSWLDEHERMICGLRAWARLNARLVRMLGSGGVKGGGRGHWVQVQQLPGRQGCVIEHKGSGL